MFTAKTRAIAVSAIATFSLAAATAPAVAKPNDWRYNKSGESILKKRGMTNSGCEGLQQLYDMDQGLAHDAVGRNDFWTAAESMADAQQVQKQAKAGGCGWAWTS